MVGKGIDQLIYEHLGLSAADKCLAMKRWSEEAICSRLKSRGHPYFFPRETYPLEERWPKL